MKAALAVDYDNFNDVVAKRQGYDRADVYTTVWSACRQIEEPTAVSPVTPTLETESASGSSSLTDRTDEYRQRDLHGDGTWPAGPKPRYGGVVFNPAGRILLREPARSGLNGS